jgi:hypothetical protein
MSRTETVAEGNQSFEDEDEEEASGDTRASQSSRSSMGFLLASIATRKKTLKKPVKATPVKELPCVVELCRAINVPQMVRSSKLTGSSGGGVIGVLQHPLLARALTMMPMILGAPILL